MPSILKHVAADERRAFIWRSVLAAAASACLISAPTLAADPVPQNDLLNAELWMQTAIEYRANCLTVYALDKVRLNEALADTNWTAYDQTGSYQNLPPAVIIDLDETAIDNSAYEAGLVVNDTRCKSQNLGRLDQGRTGEGGPRRCRVRQLCHYKGREGVLRQQPQRGSEVGHQAQSRGARLSDGRQRRHFAYAKGQARMVRGRQGLTFSPIAKDYRVLLRFGDQIDDFGDKYNTSLAERDKLFEELKAHVGHDWMMLANPAYGSFESAPYDHDFKLSDDEKRVKKLGVLLPWPAKP